MRLRLLSRAVVLTLGPISRTLTPVTRGPPWFPGESGTLVPAMASRRAAAGRQPRARAGDRPVSRTRVAIAPRPAARSLVVLQPP